MSATEGGVRRRPDLWSYISFSRPASRRRGSSSLPSFRNTSYDDDLHEKPARRYTGDLHQLNASMYGQPRRTRLLRYVAMLFIVLLVLFCLSPDRRYRFKQYVGNRTSIGKHTSVDTTRCSRPFSEDKQLVQYALMVDAGSQGSRIHVYKFNNCGPTPELENEEFVQTPKKEGGSGLSSYGDDAEGAAKSLDVLLEAAVINVPEAYRSCTPIAVKATAGLRKLGMEKSENILRAVRNRLETVYPFAVISPEKKGIEVMDGRDEGVYAWITTNYLLGHIGTPEDKPTAAVFDLGGGSTQIVFQPSYPGEPEGSLPKTLADGDHKYDLSFGGRDFTLYQHSYLGYGLMAARENLHQLVFLDAHETSETKTAPESITNPCIAPGLSRRVEVTLPPGHVLGEKVSVNMTGPAFASGSQCRAYARRTLHKEDACTLAPCAFAGVHQPALNETFATEDIYLFSYFYDRLQPLGLEDAFTLEHMKDIADKVCSGSEGWNHFSNVDGAIEELQQRPEHCLDLNFMLALLHYGYEMPLTRTVKIAKKIGGNELGWCLGASIPLLSPESGWTCRDSTRSS